MKKIVFLVVLVSTYLTSLTAANSFNWTTTKDGIFRDGVPFFLNGQSWAKKTGFTYNTGTSNQTLVKEKLSELSALGVNTIRIYGSPDDSDWDGSSNYANLIKWIEEWNVANPDGGDPNKAMYYMVQISPGDPQSSLSADLPENSTASFNRAISDLSNPASVSSLVKAIDDITGGSQYLLGYLIYHELNVSSKYVSWFASIGASGIENFMNSVADAIHNTYAPGKLVAHTGDATEPTDDIYNSIELLDATAGNVFANFDMIGFDLYISTDGLLDKDQYYNRIVNRRGFSVNDDRGWFIGETGASYDLDADPGSVAAANYTNPQGGANLQIMWHLTKELGNMIGFMLFTVQDNDKGETVSNSIKQRGYYDCYGDKKFLYYVYPDVINEISTNNRYHSTESHNIGVDIVDEGTSYTITFTFKNKTASEMQFLYTIHADDASSKQRFSLENVKEYISLQQGEDSVIVTSIIKNTSNKLVAVSSNVIKEYSPANSYLWGREHLLDDAISTIAGLDIISNPPNSAISSTTLNKSHDFLNGLIIIRNNQVLRVPDGNWQLSVYNLNGLLIYQNKVFSFEQIEFDKLLSGMNSGIAIYTLKRIQF